MTSEIPNDEHRQILSRKIVAAASSILSGKLGIIAGARQLCGLGHQVGADRDPDFLFFIGVESESDDLPIGEVRKHWNPEALRAKDAQVADYEARLRERAFEVCRSLIQTYDRAAFARQTMREIVGNKLSAVVFGVFGDLGLQFDGPSLVARNPVSLKTGERILRFGEPGFCDALWSQLGHIVSDVQISDDELRIKFADQSSFVMSLREADYVGPEAGTYYAADKKMIVFTWCKHK